MSEFPEAAAAVVAQLVHPALLIDQAGRILAASPPVQEALAGGGASLAGRALRDMIAPADRAGLDAALATARAEIRLRFLTPWAAALGAAFTARRTVPESTDSAILLQVQHIPPQRGATTADVTPATSGGARHHRLAAIVEGTDGGTWAWNVQTGEVVLNRRWAEIAGYSLEELEPVSIETWMALAHPDDLKRSKAALQRHFTGKDACYDTDLRMRHKAGHWVWVRDSGTLRTWTADGRPEWMYGVHLDIGARTENETRLRRSEALMSRAGQLAGLGSWEIDLRCGSVFWSEETFRIYGVGPDHSPTAEDMIAFCMPEVRPLFAEALRRGYFETNPWDLELPIRRQDGAARWVRFVGEAIFEGDTAVRLNGALQDITDRKSAEDLLTQALDDAHEARNLAQEKAAILSISLANSNVVAWTAIPDAGQSWFGENMNDLLGLPPGMVPDSAALRARLHPEDRALAFERQERLFSGEAGEVAHDFRVRHGDGGWRWFHSEGRRIDRSAQGLPDMLCGSLTDITKMKEYARSLADALARAERAAEEAKTREDMLQASARCGGMGHWIVSSDDSEGWASDAVGELLGYGPGEFRSTHDFWRKLFHPDDLDDALIAMQAVIEDRADVYEHEQRLRHADGNYHWYRTVGRKIDRSAEGRPYLISGAIMSIDALKQTERQLAETAKAAQRASERLNTLADNAPGALFEYRLDAAGNFHLDFFSGMLPGLMGVPRAEIEADPTAFRRNIHPDDIAVILERLEAAKQGLTPAEFTYRVDHPEKGLRWILGSIVPAVRQGGEITFYCSAIDITDQKAAEEQAT